MALEGTVKTPLGTVSKKTALILGGVVVAIGGVVWYRHQNAPSTGTIPEQEINPATGYAFGSAEDLAALAQQNQSPAGSVGSGGGGGSTGSSDTSKVISNNQEWVQQVLSYMQDNGVIYDAGPMASSLGKYVTGAYLTDTDVANVQQAIAVKGMPPVAGVTGYPPSMNRTPPTSGSTTPTPAPTQTPPNDKPPAGILWRRTYPAATSIRTQFAGSKGANLYEIFVLGKLWSHVTGDGGIGPYEFTVPGLKPNTRYSIGIQPVSPGGHAGPLSTATVTTKKA